MGDTEVYYYGDDSSIAGKLKLWIENVFEDTYYVDVRCDDACKCEVEKLKNPSCKIEAKVRFPNKENMDYYGYKNDYVTVQMSGEDKHACGRMRVKHHGDVPMMEAMHLFGTGKMVPSKKTLRV